MLMSLFLAKVYVMKYQLHEAHFGVDVIQRVCELICTNFGVG